MSVPASPAIGSGLLVFAAVAAFLEGNEVASGASRLPVPAPAGPILQIRARELWSTAGERIPDALLVIEGGRIRSVGSARDIDPSQPLVVHEGVVTAGLIGCRTQSGTRGELQDDTRPVLSAALAAHAVDLESMDLQRALEAGITALGIAPGPQNLVGGLACVVKTSGGRMLEAEAGLALSLSSATLGRSITQGGFLFGAAHGPENGNEASETEANDSEPAESESAARPDGGPEWSERTMRGTREPTSYAGAVAMLRQLLREGEGAFGHARKGELPVTIEAWDRHEVLRAVALAQEFGLVGAIRGAPLAGDPNVVAALQASGLGVIVGPYTSAQTRPSLESVKKLSAAGVPVAFALDAPLNAPETLRISAVRALRAGATREAVWKALTEDAARLAGVATSTGKLAAGLEADFVLWSGDPLDLQSRVMAVYVDGKRAWTAPDARASAAH